MSLNTPATASILLFKGGPTLIDLLINAAELRIIVTGPRMLFERLELVTTLSAFDGCTAQNLVELAGSLEGSIHCGLVGVQPVAITVESHRSGAVLQIDLGPASMYQSELILRTRTGETFQALIRRVFSADGARPFFVGVHPVTAIGHLEHHHGDGGGEPHGHHPHNEGGDHGHS